jgi:hypothetical protein
MRRTDGLHVRPASRRPVRSSRQAQVSLITTAPAPTWRAYHPVRPHMPRRIIARPAHAGLRLMPQLGRCRCATSRGSSTTTPSRNHPDSNRIVADPPAHGRVGDNRVQIIERASTMGTCFCLGQMSELSTRGQMHKFYRSKLGPDRIHITSSNFDDATDRRRSKPCMHAQRRRSEFGS